MNLKQQHSSSEGLQKKSSATSKFSCILFRTAHLAALVIMNGMTISVVGQSNNIKVMDSHLHGQLGTICMVGIITVDKVEELLIFVKQQLSPHFNICSLTFENY